jgi:phosphatidate cytidylyltransferase
MTRAFSAAALIAVLVLAVGFGPPWATLALGVLASALAASELVALAGSGRTSLVRLAALTSGVVTASFAIGYWSVGWSPLVGPILPVLCAVLLAAVLIVWGGALSSGAPGPDARSTRALLFMAPLYVGLPLGVLVWVRLVHGREALLLPIVIVAASDTAQYYTGRAIGRRKLAPRISPAKTVEGAVGGLVVAATVAALLAPRWLGGSVSPTRLASPLVAAGVGVMLALAGMVGDLFESFLKRRAGVKDSSSVIPGHGGVLDRLDSHLFAAPLYYLVLRHLR